MSTDVYSTNYAILSDPGSESSQRYHALVQIKEEIESSNAVAGLAAVDIGTYIKLLRKSSGRPEERNTHAYVFEIIWKLCQMKGYRELFLKGGLPELCLDFVKQEKYRTKILAMLYHMLDKSDLVEELVELGVMDILFKYAYILDTEVVNMIKPRMHVFHSLAIISSYTGKSPDSKPIYSEVLIKRGIANLVKKYALNIHKEQAFENFDLKAIKPMMSVVNKLGLDILFNISHPVEDMGVNDEYKRVFVALNDANVLEDVKNFCTDYSDAVALSAFKIIWRLASKLHETTSLKYRAGLIRMCKMQGTTQPGHRRFCALTILMQMAKNNDNLELIVNSGVFDMCATLGLEETGDMLAAVVKLLFVLSSTRFSAVEQAGRSDCPRVLVKILSDNNFEVPSTEGWHNETSSQALLTLVNLALYGDNISNALLDSGTVTVLKKLMHQKNVIGMIATMGLGYIFGDENSAVDVTDIPKISPDVFDVMLATLENSLEGKNSHGVIVWSIHEICLAFKCFSVSRHNLDIVANSIPYLVKILYDFSEEYGETDHDRINVETIECVLTTLVKLSYSKPNIITLIELGPAFEVLLEKVASLLEEEEPIARTIDTILLSIQNEKEIIKVMERDGKIRTSGRVDWDNANNEDQLNMYLKTFNKNLGRKKASKKNMKGLASRWKERTASD